MIIKVNEQTAVIFDLDDTLYYELDYLISAYQEIAFFLDKHNDKKLFAIMFSLYRNKQDVFGFLSEKYAFEKSILINKYRNHFPDIKLNAGGLEIFDKIKNKKGSIGILTDGREITQRNKIKALEIESYIDFISISEKVGFEKPNEFPFNNMMNQIPVQEYYYIADNIKKDFIVPNKLNWSSVGLIDSGKNIHSNFYHHVSDENLPKELVYSLAELKII